MKVTTEFAVVKKKLEGNYLLIPGTSTDKVCHIKRTELEAGIVITYAIDHFDAKIYVHPTVDLIL